MYIYKRLFVHNLFIFILYYVFRCFHYHEQYPLFLLDIIITTAH